MVLVFLASANVEPAVFLFMIGWNVTATTPFVTYRKNYNVLTQLDDGD